MRNTNLKIIVWKALLQHRWRSLATAVSVAASIILEVLPPLILARAVDSLTGNVGVSLSLACGYFAMLAVSGLVNAWREAMIVATGEGLTHSLRTAMMRKLHHLPADYFTTHEAGQISALQVNDVDAIEDMFSSGLVSMITDLGTVAATLAVIFTKSTGLGIILLIALPALSAFTAYVQKRMLAAHTQNRKATAQASGILPETMHTIRSLHVYHAEAFAQRRYDRAILKSFQAIEQTNFYDAVYSPVILTVSAAVIGVMMSLSGQSGAFRSWFGMSVGTAVALIAYVNSIFTPLSSIGMEIQTIQGAAAGWKRVQAFMNEEELPERLQSTEAEQESPDLARGKSAGPEKVGKQNEPPDLAQSKDTENVIIRAREAARTPDNQGTINRRLPDSGSVEISDVCFSYDGSHPVLQHFSLNVQKGEFVTLTGRTGIGKSTLFKLLLGLYEPQEGNIFIEGHRPQELSDEVRRQIICCVQQKVEPIPGTIRDQVTLGNDTFSDEQIWKALETAGLAWTVRALPDQLMTPYQDSIFSQGQKQLLMIARAIVSDPQILLLDEITAGLDSATEKMVTGALKAASENRTVLSISHRLSEVISGRIVQM